MLKKKNLKLITLGLILVLSLGLVACKGDSEGIVAEVDGEGITIGDFERNFEIIKSVYESQFGEGIMAVEIEPGVSLQEDLIENIISRLVMEKVVLNDAEKREISLSPEELQANIDEAIEKIGGVDSFNEYLSTNKISKEEFDEDMRKAAIINKHRSIIMEETSINDKDAKKFFDKNKEDLQQVRASHILVLTEEEAEAILKELEAGAKFEDLATEKSKDSQSALRGGDLGYFVKNGMVQEVSEAAFGLEVGGVSGVVPSEAGFHIIRLDEKKDSYESLKEDIENILKEEAYGNSLADLENKAKIEIYKENIKIEEPQPLEDPNKGADQLEEESQEEEKKDN